MSGIAALPEAQREQWFEHVMLDSFKTWLELADQRLAGTEIRCFAMPGNDDPDSLEGVIDESARVEACDEKWVRFDGYQMLSLGYSNITPWNSPRELDEDALHDRLVGWPSRCPITPGRCGTSMSPRTTPSSTRRPSSTRISTWC